MKLWSAVLSTLVMLSGCDSGTPDPGSLEGKWQHTRAAACDPRLPILTFEDEGIRLTANGSTQFLLERYELVPIRRSTPGAAPMTRIDFDYPDLRGDTGKLVPTHVGVEHVKGVIIARVVAQGDTLLTEEQAEKLLIFFTRQRCS